jgi:DNA-binding response OmpR family regulator
LSRRDRVGRLSVQEIVVPNILLIDDQKDLRELTACVLHDAGFEVWEAATGHEGVARATAKPDLVILDVRLPDLDGFEVCRRLREIGATKHVPILFFTGEHADIEHRIRALDEGGDGYLVRPVDPAELIGTVRLLLRHQPLEGRAAPRSAEADLTAATTLARELAAAMKRVQPFNADERRLIDVGASRVAIAVSNARIERAEGRGAA